MLNCLSSNMSILFGLLIGNNTSMFTVRCQFIVMHLDKMFYLKFIVWCSQKRREFYPFSVQLPKWQIFISVHPFFRFLKTKFQLSDQDLSAVWIWTETRPVCVMHQPSTAPQRYFLSTPRIKLTNVFLDHYYGSLPKAFKSAFNLRHVFGGVGQHN